MIQLFPFIFNSYMKQSYVLWYFETCTEKTILLKIAIYPKIQLERSSKIQKWRYKYQTAIIFNKFDSVQDYYEHFRQMSSLIFFRSSNAINL